MFFMSILSGIKDIIEKNTSVTVGNQINERGQLPVYVTDKSQSITAGWSLKYFINRSQYNNKVFVASGHFDTLIIKKFSIIYSLLGKVYQQFVQGVNVEIRQNQNKYAEYQEKGLWFTVFELRNSIKVAMTITDEASPFHMLKEDFYIKLNQNNQPVVSGYNKIYNQQDDTFSDRFNATMFPAKKRFIPIVNEGTVMTAKVAGSYSPSGRVALDQNNTEIVYLIDYSTTNSHVNERRLLASIYEKLIVDLVEETAGKEISKSTPPTTQNSIFAKASVFGSNAFAQQGGAAVPTTSDPFAQAATQTPFAIR
jgi:hypothetical protein